MNKQEFFKKYLHRTDIVDIIKSELVSRYGEGTDYTYLGDGYLSFCIGGDWDNLDDVEYSQLSDWVEEHTNPLYYKLKSSISTANKNASIF